MNNTQISATLKSVNKMLAILDKDSTKKRKELRPQVSAAVKAMAKVKKCLHKHITH